MVRASADDTCDVCHFFEPFSYQGHEGLGVCMRYSPTVVYNSRREPILDPIDGEESDDHLVVMVRPQVRDDDRCGEFIPSLARTGGDGGARSFGTGFRRPGFGWPLSV